MRIDGSSTVPQSVEIEYLNTLCLNTLCLNTLCLCFECCRNSSSWTLSFFASFNQCAPTIIILIMTLLTASLFNEILKRRKLPLENYMLYNNAISSINSVRAYYLWNLHCKTLDRIIYSINHIPYVKNHISCV